MIKVSNIKNNPNNPRTIDEDKLEKLKRSIKSFPEMMEKRSMICVTDVDGKLYPLGGNMRLRAIKDLGMKEIPKSWVSMADEWTEEQRREFIIKDNASLGDWDLEDLQENWDLDLISEWGVDLELDEVEESTEKEQIDLSDDVNGFFEVIVTADSEREQEEIYNNLIERGYKCRVLTL